MYIYFRGECAAMNLPVIFHISVIFQQIYTKPLMNYTPKSSPWVIISISVNSMNGTENLFCIFWIYRFKQRDKSGKTQNFQIKYIYD